MVACELSFDHCRCSIQLYVCHHIGIVSCQGLLLLLTDLSSPVIFLLSNHNPLSCDPYIEPSVGRYLSRVLAG